MLIGIDASRLVPDSMAGTQYYLYNLIKHMSKIDRSNDYIVYTRAALPKAFFEDMTCGNPHFIESTLSQVLLSFTQYSLAKATYNDMIDVLICPWQTMPVIYRKGLKVLSVIHDLAFPFYRFGPTLFTCIFSDHIIAVSDYTKSELMAKFLIDGSKITVSHEGVDKEYYQKSSLSDISLIRKKYDLSKNYLLFVGTHVKRKNIPRMIRAFGTLLKNRNDLAYDFVIAGANTKHTHDIKSLVEKLNLVERVKILGKVPSEDIVPLLSGSTFLTYVSSTEGFGLPILEAMSCGIPVLTANIGALPEVGGNAAYYVNPRSEYAIYAGMLELLTNNDLYTDLVNAGYENLRRFSWQEHANTILGIITTYAH